MAIFERKAHGRNNLSIDDTQVLLVNFESTQNVQGHMEYVISVQRQADPTKKWRICKRYNDFLSLHNEVVLAAGVALPLPSKKLFGNMDRNFINERQAALQVYLKSVLMNPILASSLGVRRFLDPESYVLSLQEQAMQHVAMSMRGELNYELLKPIPDMGWRLRKHYFQVRAKLNPRADLTLQYVEYGPDKYLDDRELQGALRLFLQVTHPYIQPLEYVHCSDLGCIVISQFNAEGSLRDKLCNTKPKISFLKKYGSPKHVKPLPLHEIQLYGRQVIDALVFLHEKGIPYGHLHTGNIILVDGQVRLLNIESGILGLPSYYRPFFVQHKKIATLEDIDVYCMGHVLYEMAIGRPLHESVCDIIPSTCPYPIRNLLERLLTPECVRAGLPSLKDLQEHPLFLPERENAPRGTLRLPSSLKEALRTACANIERRLQDEQKLVRNQKKISKVQEKLTSEDEIKKRHRRLKEERKANHANNQTSKNSHPRSDSPNSQSTATSAGTITPPLEGMKAVGDSLPTLEAVDECNGRSSLLNSICAFDKSKLRGRSGDSTKGN